MASASVAGGSFRLGDALGRAWDVWGRLIGPFFLVYVITLVPTVANTLMMNPHDPKAAFGAGFWLSVLVGSVFGLVAQAATVDAAMRVADGGPAAFGQALGRGFGRVLPLLGAWLIAMVLIMLGMVLFVVPGIMVVVAYLVVTQVVVMERLGPWGALKRSARLTKGSRWKLFGFMLLMGLFGGISAGATALGTAALGRLGGAVVQLLVSPTLTLFTVVATTMVYRELVANRDGFGGARLAAVFD
jgi:hypothetical protein